MKTKSTRLHSVFRALPGTLGCALGLAMAVSPAIRAAEIEAAELQPQEAAGETDNATANESGREIEAPVVRERMEYGQTITEYRRRGGVYMMTVKPRVGPTQYWNDPDGDGQFQRSTSDNIDESLNLPKWRLGGW